MTGHQKIEKIKTNQKNPEKQKKRYKEKDQMNKKDKKQSETSKFIIKMLGLMSKIDSLAYTIDNYEPTLTCLVETHLTKEE